MSPWDNLRKFVIGSPPWVIFMLSLAIMAVGVLVLAYRLRVDPDYGKEHALSSLRLCHRPEGQHKPKQTVPYSMFNVSLPVTLKASHDFLSTINNSNELTVGIGRFYSGQIGLKGSTGHSHNWTFLLPLQDSERCNDKNCHDGSWHTCLIVLADDAASLPNLLNEYGCASNWSHFTLSDKRLHLLSFSNIVDESLGEGNTRVDSSEITAMPSTAKPVKFCTGGTEVKVHIDEGEHFVLIPLLHDTVAARLHLLYTSYFLFLTLLFLLCYAMCKGHNFHKSPRYLTPGESTDELLTKQTS